jgi:hypothetical protein
MAQQTRKMSEIMKEMMERLLRKPNDDTSSEAAHVALFFANMAWNECVGIAHPRESYRNVWESIEAENPALWNELKSNDIDGMIHELIEYKKKHFPKDRRRILVCGGTPEGTIHVEWLPHAAPGVDVKWETQLYGMVRSGHSEEAIRFLQKTRKMARGPAIVQVEAIKMQLGMK